MTLIVDIKNIGLVIELNKTIYTIELNDTPKYYQGLVLCPSPGLDFERYGYSITIYSSEYSSVNLLASRLSSKLIKGPVIITNMYRDLNLDDFNRLLIISDLIRIRSEFKRYVLISGLISLSLWTLSFIL